VLFNQHRLFNPLNSIKYALITGANKSIGFETARQLLQLGYYVYLSSRDLANGQQAAHLHAEGLI
jgi:NAD(P)-dependent dehydrogenase (short-subunit alcohol dehydrogenase family)